jgi:hypothetical protein
MTNAVPNTVTLVTTQTVPQSTYLAGNCSCGVCSAFDQPAQCNTGDYQVGVKVCCGGSCASQPICGTVNSNACPIVGGSQALSVTANSNGNISCTYNVTQFTSAADIDTYATFAGSNDPQLNTVILPYFCNQSVTTCPTDPTTGKPMTSCSRYVSTQSDGAICQTWLAAYPQYTNSAYSNYCSTNNTPDCTCYNRTSDSVFNIFNNQATAPPGCYFKPCMDSSTYLIPPSLTNPVCPANTCSSIQQIYNENSNALPPAQITAKLGCNIQPKAYGGFSYWWILVLVLAIFIILIILIWIISANMADSTVTNSASQGQTVEQYYY